MPTGASSNTKTRRIAWRTFSGKRPAASKVSFVCTITVPQAKTTPNSTLARRNLDQFLGFPTEKQHGALAILHEQEDTPMELSGVPILLSGAKKMTFFLTDVSQYPWKSPMNGIYSRIWKTGI